MTSAWRRSSPTSSAATPRSSSSAPTSTTRDDEQLADELEAATFEYSVELLVVLVGRLREASLAVVAAWDGYLGDEDHEGDENPVPVGQAIAALCTAAGQ